MSLMPAASARCAPLAFGTSTMPRTPGIGPSSATTSSMSRICGIAFGLTNEPISMRLMPAAISALINATLVAVGTNCGMFCRPSRGPTSTISTLSMALPAV